ncbi:ABC transporter ATP-binding protein [Clostridium sp. JS66]|uniref:ABC transporter ATP-binding protein n=1 Tax=Clostridium sp. JS66 TaxID=3064705 RepID=UPI00298E6585|nr:ABC transporter ATP-binding protein [Clostridium sp. JS66]WPC44136.1 ABC transporter ATP-binding protein [Clostridium sp. JS66]
MNCNENAYCFKDIINSFKYMPRIFKILCDIDKKYVILITILNIANGFIPTLAILSTQYLINSIQVNNLKSFQYILIPFVLYVSISFSGAIIAQAITYFQNMFKMKLSYNLNLIILEKSKKFNLSDFENSEVYDKLKRANDGIGEKPFTVFTLMLSLFSQVVTLVSTSIILMAWKPWVILIIPIVPIISSICMIRLGYEQFKIHRERASKERKSWYLNFIMTNDLAFKEVKIYKLAEYFIPIFKRLNIGFISQDKKILIKTAKLGFMFELSDGVIGGIICLLIIRDAYVGRILLGNTVAYIRCISSISTSVQAILETISGLCQNNLYIKQFFEFLDLPNECDRKLNDLVSIDEINSIEFKNVSFKYPNRTEYALKNISFKVCKGQNVALVGRNGSGKTTLVKLIAGFYENYEGEILINGVSMKKIGNENIRERMGVVFQDYNKYELSCRENIAVGKLNYINDDWKLLSSMKKVSGIELLEDLPNGLNTQLGVWFEEGVQLSGGQWQKIALARAFLREADCYILDEPSSALDAISEYEIFRKLYKLTKDKIGVFITHRLFNIKKMNSKILVLYNGEIIEEGTHNELMSINSHYKSMYKLQNFQQNDLTIGKDEENYYEDEKCKINN